MNIWMYGIVLTMDMNLYFQWSWRPGWQYNKWPTISIEIHFAINRPLSPSSCLFSLVRPFSTNNPFQRERTFSVLKKNMLSFFVTRYDIFPTLLSLTMSIDYSCYKINADKRSLAASRLCAKLSLHQIVINVHQHLFC